MDSVDDVEAGEDPQHMRLKKIPAKKKTYDFPFSLFEAGEDPEHLRLKEIPAASASVFVILY